MTREAVPPCDTRRRYRACARLLTTPDCDDLLVLDPRTMAVHTLNVSLRVALEACDGERSTEEIVVEFMDRFDLDAAEASRETYRALKILRTAGLVEAA